MFARLGEFVIRTRVAMLIAGVVLVLAGGAWGTGVTATGVLSQGGLEDRGSEAFQAMERIRTEVGRQDADVIVLYSSPDLLVTDPAFREAVTAALGRTSGSEQVEQVFSPYDQELPAQERAALVSKDQHAAYAVVQLRGSDDDQRMQSYLDLKNADGGNVLLAEEPVKTELGGIRPMFDDVNTGILDGASKIEMVTLPTLFILLLFVFGSVVAASIPLLIAILSLMGGLVLLRLLNAVTDISVFALNVLAILALGLAVDYGLFMVSRFREELRAGFDVRPAVRRTMQTAGRTVLVSGVIVTLALTGLLVFPQAYVRSMGLGAMVAVFLAMLTTLTVLPAFLAVVGRRVDSLRIPTPWRRRRSAHSEVSSDGAWGRVARTVIRRPLPFAIGITALLLLLAAPVLGVNFGTSDEKSLAPDAASRVVAERLTDEFAVDQRKAVYVLVSGLPSASPATVRSASEALADRIGALPGFDPQTARVVGFRERVVDGAPQASAVVVASHRDEWSSEQAGAAVGRVRDLGAPPGTEMLVGGLAADLKDQLSSIRSSLPLMAGVILVVTLLFLFFAFGSVLLPLVTILVNLLSIAAAFGPIVWIFQQGNLSGLLDFTATNSITAMETVLIIAFAFGLSMDYSVFLLSRIRERWDATGDTAGSIVTGVQRTGVVITSAAVLLSVTIGSFVLVEIKDLKFIAIGLFLTILLDATVVRMLLMPAILRLLGPAAWWSPGPLRRFYATYGIRESDAPASTGRRHAVLAGQQGGGPGGH